MERRFCRSDTCVDNHITTRMVKPSDGNGVACQQKNPAHKGPGGYVFKVTRLRVSVKRLPALSPDLHQPGGRW